ncbi:MAG: flavodoxin family protein [Eubacteriales bacterium]|nr:flavodoxin family protein [Eubacteriales bacterium]
MMKTLIAYSSKTGNTKKVAEAIHATTGGDFVDIIANPDVDLDAYEQVIFGFWVDKGGPDEQANAFFETVRNKRVGIFFTLGAWPESDHANDVEQVITEMAEDNGNTVVTTFRCMGKIDPELTKMFERMGDHSPHRMDEERRRRHEEAAKHPDETDLQNAQKAFKCMA